ncbi:hypothetical protein NEDG_01593 [Nematocida displodere]|uniref:RING-type domain-containing protein n=1 Tax=Nematocida displodere TaxID=1805483 RepID=A0A177EIF7_9MICR|nr:hypothetical protein NEDG_01593 [Nematocida displodere]
MAMFLGYLTTVALVLNCALGVLCTDDIVKMHLIFHRGTPYPKGPTFAKAVLYGDTTTRNSKLFQGKTNLRRTHFIDGAALGSFFLQLALVEGARCRTIDPASPSVSIRERYAAEKIFSFGFQLPSRKENALEEHISEFNTHIAVLLARYMRNVCFFIDYHDGCSIEDLNILQELGVEAAVVMARPDTVDALSLHQVFKSPHRQHIILLQTKEVDWDLLKESGLVFVAVRRDGSFGHQPVTLICASGVIISFLVFFGLVTYCQMAQQRRDAPKSSGLAEHILESMPLQYHHRNISKIDIQSCVICLENFTSASICRVLPCDHVYHSECIDPWLTERSTRCPYCQKQISM